jgi:hypothetical protein
VNDTITTSAPVKTFAAIGMMPPLIRIMQVPVCRTRRL